MADPSGDLLLVRHREGEAGRYLYNETFVHWLEMERPALLRRVRLHRTGGEAPSLDGVRAVLFWLADPLREVYPACYREAAALAARARERGIRILNHPDALSNAISSRLARLWEDAGIPTPSSRRFADLDAFRAALDGLEYPILVRAEQAHGRAAMHTCRTREEAAALGPEELAFPIAVSPLVDTREGYRSTRPGSVWARFYHKMRILAAGDRVLKIHLKFSEVPVVGGRTSLFEYGARTARLWRLGLSPDVHRALAAQRRWLARPIRDPDLWRRAARALDLDYVAFDYADFADGRPILWEANPHPVLPTVRGIPRLWREPPRTWLKAAVSGFKRGPPHLLAGRRRTASRMYRAIAGWMEDVLRA